ncbi:MAG TPA: 3-deoxy-D-manno-octulosonic acid transferase [Vicinamibacterales bacterium]|nr:3-deoxy-D-manno-octulosonic acid transferase [Vicinamibacterales bacterium]
MNLLYSVATLLALIVFAPYFLYQALRHHKYVGSIGQRLGYLPVSFNLDADDSIWVHAVSVGEVLAARPIIAGLRERYPDLRLFLSTTTMSGQQIARSVSDVDAVFYFPFDFTFIVRRTLDLVKPRLFVMIETEIWPSLLRECRRRGVRTVLVNGRLSPRSYPRYRMIRPFIKRVLADIDRFCVQSDEMARRFAMLGANPARITVTGSLKFDSLDPSTAPGRGRERVLRFFRISPGRPVLVAGSTSKGEEDAVIRAFNRLRMTTAGGNALLILAARHRERFNEVERLCQREGLSTARRSDLPIDKEPKVDAVILDTFGELAQLYQIATAVFVGGSLVPAGGHNILEPAVHGKPIIFGPHMDNFAEIARGFLAQDAAIQVRTPRELEDAVVSLIGDPVRRAKLGAAARALVDANRGAKGKTFQVLTDLFPPRDGGGLGVVRPFRVIH